LFESAGTGFSPLVGRDHSSQDAQMMSNGTQRVDEESAAATSDESSSVVEKPPAPQPPVEATPAPPADAARATPEGAPPPADVAPEGVAAAPAEPTPEAAPPLSIPPSRTETLPAPASSLAPPVEIYDDFAPRPTFWSTRPNRPWMLVSGSAIVIAFLVGAMTGRLLQPQRSPEFVVSAPLHASEVAAARAPAPTVAPAEVAAAVPSAPPIATAAAAKRTAVPAFNAKAAKAAIDGVTPRLKACKHAGDPVGPASVMVTFAPTGRVSSASITTTSLAGTRTGNCIVQRLRDLRIAEFTGSAVTVKRSVTVR
jgi:hypothetical protein